MDVIKEIATWAKNLPAWQSDTLRRIFTSENLSVRDEDEIFAMLLSAYKVQDKNTPFPPRPVPFSTVVQESTNQSRKVLLTELNSLVGVNALVPNQSIKFALNGLTVIYGENSAGKSGYARVLKHACHARDKGEPILSDVTQQKKQIASAIIEIKVDGDVHALKWRAGCLPSELLSEIAVFDAHCARVFIDEANEVVYMPYGLDVFGKLAALFKSMKVKIVKRKAEIPQKLTFIDEFTPTTNVGLFLSDITANSDVQRIEILSKLNDTQISRLQELRDIIVKAKANSPKKQSSQLRRIKFRFEQLLNKVTTISEALSIESLKNLKMLRESADAAVKAAEFASTQAFINEPLPSTGSDPWRLLFDAAKTFSEQDAYPNEEFPVIREGSVCVLCQQPLSEIAAQRMQRFKDFVLNDAATKKANSEKTFQNAFKDLTTVDIDYLKSDKALSDEIRDYDENLAKNVEHYFIEASKRKQATIKAISEGIWDVIPDLHASIAQDLKQTIATLETSALQFDKADNPEEFKKLQDELCDLEDRERLRKRSDEIKEFINKKKLEKALQACEKALDTTGITRFGSELMEKAVTKQLESALQSELKFFNVQCVPVNIRKSGEKGKTKYQLIIQPGILSSGVLSEGEQRIVAIASFLAELSTSSKRSPIIFDDPVSSLDHLFRERVANRLVTEARVRQVIVFTHDIVMLLALERECAEQRVPLLIQTIRRSSKGPGECPPIGSRPWHANSTKERIGMLKNKIAQFEKLQSKSKNEYEAEGVELYGKLRETWERAIEEHLELILKPMFVSK